MSELPQSIESWFSILNWKSSPLFGSCHQISDYEEFKAQFYSCEKIGALERDIFRALEDGNRSDMKLHGPPGAGKTTFLYYLMKKTRFAQDGVASNYVFYIFHANRADDSENYRELAQDQILQAWHIFYLECDHEIEYKRITELNCSNKEKLTRLSRYYVANKHDFHKTLIIAIDDIDLLEDEMAYKIATAAFKDIELASVVKLISIRACTLKHYTPRTKKYFDEFYPSLYAIPNSSLFEIIEFRIKKICSNTEYKNPFSKHLCDEILFKLFEGNKRQSLAILKAILENSQPGKIHPSSDEKFVQNYIENSAINTFLKHHTLPNLHDPSYRSSNNYPLPYDVVQLLRHTKDINIILGCLNDIAALRSHKDEWLAKNDSTLRIRDNDLDYALKKLIDDGAITKLDKHRYELTQPGIILALYSSRLHYNELCKDLLSSLDTDDKYWSRFRVSVDYQKVVDTFMAWKSRRE